MATSPSKKKVIESKSMEMNFYDALKEVANGRKITKLEWNDSNYYLILSGGKLKIHNLDGLLHDLIITDGDMSGEDWVIIE